MSGRSDNTRSALFMIGAMAAFAINDTFTKSASDELPLYQILVLRGVATTLLLYVYTLASGGTLRVAKSRDRRLIGLRTVAEIAVAYFFLTALFNMPLANATAILQTLPLAVTLATTIVFGEKVGWRRLTAIAIGFLGMLLIVQPGTEGFTVYSIYALVAVVFVVIRDLAARPLSPTVSSGAVAVYTAAGVTLAAGLACLTIEWQPVSPKAGLQIAGSVVAILFAYVFSVTTMRLGEVGFVAPFRYASLVVALIAGFLVFGEWPNTLALAGMAIVTGTGIYTLWRERRTAQAGRRLAAGRQTSEDQL